MECVKQSKAATKQATAERERERQRERERERETEIAWVRPTALARNCVEIIDPLCGR